MTVLFVEYPKCSTCKKAKAWLDEHGVEYIDRDIVLDNPTADELATWIARSGLPVRRFFNSSGMKYRELGLKARLDAGMTDRECYELLATDGMLVKRPLLVGDDFAIPGFREAAWAEALEKNGWTPAWLAGEEFGNFVDSEFASLRATMAKSGMI